ncbi:hypothetical protein TRVL_10343 [Trypanosoma vivax]|nr:hypothetical protein TRVL_10343 [Trypanosoma vivax]
MVQATRLPACFKHATSPPAHVETSSVTTGRHAANRHNANTSARFIGTLREATSSEEWHTLGKRHKEMSVGSTNTPSRVVALAAQHHTSLPTKHVGAQVNGRSLRHTLHLEGADATGGAQHTVINKDKEKRNTNASFLL